jgi:hypothetical protein
VKVGAAVSKWSGKEKIFSQLKTRISEQGLIVLCTVKKVIHAAVLIGRLPVRVIQQSGGVAGGK